MHNVTHRGFGFPWSLLFRVQTPRHAASSAGRARPERVSCIVRAPPSDPPNTAFSAHRRLPPSVNDFWRPQSFPALHRAGTHTGGGLELMQGTKSERSLHNCVCRPMEEHFPGAHLRGFATGSRASSPVAGRPPRIALANHPSPITDVKSLPRRQPAAHHHLSGSANFE
jgi:hypothetical protein